MYIEVRMIIESDGLTKGRKEAENIAAEHNAVLLETAPIAYGGDRAHLKAATYFRRIGKSYEMKAM